MNRLIACVVMLTTLSRGAPFLDSLSRIGAAVSLGAGLHEASFGALHSVPSCCSSYGSHWNLSWGIAGIIESGALTHTPLPLAVQLRLGLQNFSGRLQREEFIANVIVGDRVTRGISRFQLDARLWTVSVEPLLHAALPEHRQLSFDVGLRLDWLAIARYAQREELINPSSGAVFETGTRLRNTFAGIIPTHAHVGAAIQIGARYCIALDGKWTLQPELRGQVALSRIADVPWRVHRILAGVALLRGIEPPQRPQPIEPLPPLVLRVQTLLHGVRHINADTALVEIATRRILRRELVTPVVFFAAGSSQLDSAARIQLARIAHAAERRGLSLRLAPSIAPDEPDSLRPARTRAVCDELRRWNATVADTTAVAPSPRTISPAIADELRAVWLHTTEPLVEEQWQDVPITEPSVALHLVATVEPQNAHVSAMVSDGGITTSVPLNSSLSTTVQLSPAPLLNGQPSRITWQVSAHDSMGRTAEQSGVTIIRPILAIHDTLMNSIALGDMLMLGRSSFDAITFDDVDTAIAAYVRQVAQQGGRITLIGTTDSIGTETYNRALARRRAEAARQLLNLAPTQVRIEEWIGGASKNGSLYGRVASRGVLVRITQP